ncbi:hypothetical protein GW17_00053866 [Ensete ventricosum]|nr:hypothetical protein GW17_00053866 [Ensete ventricosum]RZS05290.1 hypothetical protein BHM03_00035775 [Ensete ventricosum]
MRYLHWRWRRKSKRRQVRHVHQHCTALPHLLLFILPPPRRRHRYLTYLLFLLRGRGIVAIPHPPRLEGRLEREGIDRPPPEGGGRRGARARIPLATAVLRARREE